MSKQYRIIFECYESSTEIQQVLSKTVMMAGSIEKPEDVFNCGLAHEEQVKLALGVFALNYTISRHSRVELFEAS